MLEKIENLYNVRINQTLNFSGRKEEKSVSGYHKYHLTSEIRKRGKLKLRCCSFRFIKDSTISRYNFTIHISVFFQGTWIKTCWNNAVVENSPPPRDIEKACSWAANIYDTYIPSRSRCFGLPWLLIVKVVNLSLSHVFRVESSRLVTDVWPRISNEEINIRWETKKRKKESETNTLVLVQRGKFANWIRRLTYFQILL